MEIGVRDGVSTAALLMGLEDHGGHLISIDIADCRRFEHAQWSFHQLDSMKDHEVVKLLLPEKLDLLFIDGDHEYESVISDLRNYGPRADIILLHDTDIPDVFPGVRRAVEKFCEETERPVTFYLGSHGMAEIAR